MKETENFGIEYTNDLNVELTGYSNFDWVGDPDDKKSTCGSAFGIGSGIVSWINMKQPIDSLSSTDA